MEHSFDIEFAQEHGMVAAILYRHMQFWIAKNKANRTNCRDGRTWTYNSVQAYCEQFPYLGTRQIRTALALLIERGILLRGNYNKRGSDRTSWYGFADEETALKGLPAHLLKSQMENQAKKPICQNDKSNCQNDKSNCQNDRALPDQSNPDTPTQINNNIGKNAQEVLELDCEIKRQANFLSEQLESIFHPRGRSQQTFSNIIRYFINSVQVDPTKISWFKEAAELARVARIEGRKAGGKALFVQTVKKRTGYGKNPKLLPGKSHEDSHARASPAA